MRALTDEEKKTITLKDDIAEMKLQTLKRLINNSKTLRISKDILPPQQLKQELQNFKELQVHDLQANLCGYSDILIYIRDISFPILKDLRLSTSNLVSLEVLERINMPQLEIFWINVNQVSSVKSLRKAHFPNLQVLGIDGNLFNDAHWLSEANLPRVYKINTEFDRKSQPTPQTITFFFKLQTKILRQIYINSDQRISEKTVTNKIKRGIRPDMSLYRTVS